MVAADEAVYAKDSPLAVAKTIKWVVVVVHMANIQ